MKTKLLKKVRKQYSIVYYPNGIRHGDYVFHKGEYVVHKGFRSIWNIRGYATKNDAIDAILKELRIKYRHLIKKDFHKGTKVWYNK